MFLVEVTWGERLRLAVERWERPPRTRTALFTAIGQLTGAKSPNTVSKLLQAKETPAKTMAQIRAVALLIALGEPVVDYGLSTSILPRELTIARIKSAATGLPDQEGRNTTCMTAGQLALFAAA